MPMASSRERSRCSWPREMIRAENFTPTPVPAIMARMICEQAIRTATVTKPRPARISPSTSVRRRPIRFPFPPRAR